MTLGLWCTGITILYCRLPVLLDLNSLNRFITLTRGILVLPLFLTSYISIYYCQIIWRFVSQLISACSYHGDLISWEGYCLITNSFKMVMTRKALNRHYTYQELVDRYDVSVSKLIKNVLFWLFSFSDGITSQVVKFWIN